jgi:hypothetical protein
MKKIILVIVLLVITGGCAYAYFEQSPTVHEATTATSTPQEDSQSIIERLAAKLAGEKVQARVDELKKEVVEKIRNDESGIAFSDGDVFYTHDPTESDYADCRRIGGKRAIDCDSWGPLQFKIPTIQHFYQTLYNEQISEKEALLVALDEEKATNLAIDIIINVEGGVYEWSSAYRREDYYNTIIPLIRDLDNE